MNKKHIIALILFCLLTANPWPPHASAQNEDPLMTQSQGGKYDNLVDFDNGTFSTVIASDTGTFGSFNNRFAQANSVLFLGVRADNGNIFINSSNDDGNTWTTIYGSQIQGSQPPILASDAAGRVYAVFKDDIAGKGRFLRFDPTAPIGGGPVKYTLAKDKYFGEMGTKFSMVYNRFHNVVHISRRLYNGTLNVLTLTGNGDVVRSRDLALKVSTTATDYWDAHYHSLAVQAKPADSHPGDEGALYLIYNPHHFLTDGTFIRKGIFFLRSLNLGTSWQKPDGLGGWVDVQTPFRVTDSINGGESIQLPGENNGYDVNLSVVGDMIHILYWVNGGPAHGVWHVRKDRVSGVERDRKTIPVSYHSVITSDLNSENLYLIGETADQTGIVRPTLYKSTDQGETWLKYKRMKLKPEQYWTYTSGMPTVTSNGNVIAATTHIKTPGNGTEALFLRYSTDGNP